ELDEQGHTVQIIAASAYFNLINIDLRGYADAKAEIDKRRSEVARYPFNLKVGPLVCGQLIRTDGDEYVFLVTMHHIISDGWSMEVFFREVGRLYSAYREGLPNPLTPLSIQYADYALWQRDRLALDVTKESVEYWRARLSDIPNKI